MLASTPSTELISCLTKTNKAISHANAAREARAPRDARKVVKMTKNAEDANELNKASRVKAAANQVGNTEREKGTVIFFIIRGVAAEVKRPCPRRDHGASEFSG